MTKNTKVTDEQSVLARYRRAEALEHEFCNQSMVLNATILPHWIKDSHCFWYTRKKRQESGGSIDIATEFRLVNAEAASNSNSEAFDHQLLADVLSRAAERDVNPNDLPISELTLELSPVRASFTAFGKRWQFDESKETCEEIKVNAPNPSGWLVSPDGKKAAFSRDHNLWVQDLESGEEYALTKDGEQYYAYGVQPESRSLLDGIPGIVSWFPNSLEALWSPDSSRVFTLQTDERQVRTVPSIQYVPQDGTVAPRVIERKYALSGDKHIVQYRMVVIDVATAKETAADYPTIDDALISHCPFNGNMSSKSNLAWWSSDSSHAYFVDMSRGQKAARMVAFNVLTGATKILFEESTNTYLNLIPYHAQPSMLRPLPETNELIWYSERSGWAHLYLYDLNTGQLKNAITSGEFVVRDIVRYDSAARALFIQIAGRVPERNPYYRELVQVNIDSGEMIIIASGNHDYCSHHKATYDNAISSSGQYAVVTRSRVDDAPVTELRNRNGDLILTVEIADISGLPESWQWPEPVVMKAADGTTDIYGVVFRPSDFDPNNSYPVVDFGMESAFFTQTPPGAFLVEGMDPIQNAYYFSFAALAELGFIVTVIDGRGTPCRSKAFHDFGYESFIQGGGIVDHVAGIKQIAKRYSYMDLNNVGIISIDGVGNGPVFGLLNHPDFYKVGAAFSVWDPRLVKEGEVLHGLIHESDCQQPIWRDVVKNLQGKLLLIAGMMDQCWHISSTFQLVDALAKANKDFDLCIQPNGGHGLEVRNAHRRVWDYLVRHLQGIEPPKNFKLVMGMEKMSPEGMPEKIINQ